MDPNVVLPFASSSLSFVFFVLLIDQWHQRRRPYQLVWAIGMLWYGLSAGIEWTGSAFGYALAFKVPFTSRLLWQRRARDAG